MPKPQTSRNTNPSSRKAETVRKECMDDDPSCSIIIIDGKPNPSKDAWMGHVTVNEFDVAVRFLNKIIDERGYVGIERGLLTGLYRTVISIRDKLQVDPSSGGMMFHEGHQQAANEAIRDVFGAFSERNIVDAHQKWYREIKNSLYR